MTEKPLHVQVAEALGWRKVQEEAKGVWCGFHADRPGMFSDGSSAVPHYDTDWSATGPLIEQHAILLQPLIMSSKAIAWQATSPWYSAQGLTPLIAVCNLLLALSKAGKLAA